MSIHRKLTTVLAATAITLAGVAPAAAQSSLSSSSNAPAPTPSTPHSWDDPMWGDKRAELNDTVEATLTRWGYNVTDPYDQIAQDVADKVIKGHPSGMAEAVREHGGQFSIEQWDNRQLNAVIAEYQNDDWTPEESMNRPIGVGVAGDLTDTILVVFHPGF